MVKQHYNTRQTLVLLSSLCLLFVISPAYAQDTNIGDMLYNLQASLADIWQMLMGTCWLFGIIFFTLGMMKLKKYGQMTVFMMAHADMVGPMLRMFVGCILMYVPWSIDMMINTIWQSDSRNLSAVQGYAAEAGGTSYYDLMGPVFSLIQVIGLIAFIRGFSQLTKAGGQGAQPGVIPRALVLIFGGVMAINIVGTLNVVRATFGLSPLT